MTNDQKFLSFWWSQLQTSYTCLVKCLFTNSFPAVFWKSCLESFLKFSVKNLALTVLVNWWPTISFTIFWDFPMFYQIFLSPQVKRWATITYKHDIYELPHKLPNDLRLKKLGNIRKVSKFYIIIAWCPSPLPKWKFW